MTVQEFIEKHGVSRRTVYRWIEDGRLKARKINGVWHIDDTSMSDDIDMTQFNTETDTDMTKGELIEQLRSENEYLRQELSQARQRHDEVQQQSNMIIMQLTKQLEQQTLLLEDMRSRSLWQRFKTALGFGQGETGAGEQMSSPAHLRLCFFILGDPGSWKLYNLSF